MLSQMTGARGPDGKPWPKRRGSSNMVLVRDAGAWSIAVTHTIDLPPVDLGAAQQAVQRTHAAAWTTA